MMTCVHERIAELREPRHEQQFQFQLGVLCQGC